MSKLKFKINTNLISIIIAVLIFIVLSFAYYLHINLLNFIAENYLKSEKIDTNLFHSSIIADILFGLTIYLKTSVDFALLIGNLMSKYPGFKNRVAIENGTEEMYLEQ